MLGVTQQNQKPQFFSYLNNRLKGYSVRIGHLDFHPVGLSLDLERSVIYQTAHPDPAVAEIPKLSASVHWRALLSGHLVADFEIYQPKVRFDLRQFTQEAKDEVPIKDKEWQEAVEAIYPFVGNRRQSSAKRILPGFEREVTKGGGGRGSG